VFSLAFFSNTSIIMVRGGKTNSRPPKRCKNGFRLFVASVWLEIKGCLLDLVHGSQATGADTHLLPTAFDGHRDLLNVGFPVSLCGFQGERPVVSKLAPFATHVALGHDECSFHHAN
jgi:hypothetical protein